MYATSDVMLLFFRRIMISCVFGVIADFYEYFGIFRNISYFHNMLLPAQQTKSMAFFGFRDIQF